MHFRRSAGTFRGTLGSCGAGRPTPPRAAASSTAPPTPARSSASGSPARSPGSSPRPSCGSSPRPSRSDPGSAGPAGDPSKQVHLMSVSTDLFVFSPSASYPRPFRSRHRRPRPDRPRLVKPGRSARHRDQPAVLGRSGRSSRRHRPGASRRPPRAAGPPADDGTAAPDVVLSSLGARANGHRARSRAPMPVRSRSLLPLLGERRASRPSFGHARDRMSSRISHRVAVRRWSPWG